MSYRRRFDRLVATIQELSLARTVEAIVEIVRTEARESTGADGATFVLRDGLQCYYVDESAIAPLWRGRRFPLESCISGWVMTHGTSAVIEDIYADPRIPVDAYRPTFVKSLVMVPIRTQKPLGAIGNYWATRRQPTPEEVATLQAIADTTAVALESVCIRQQLEERDDARAATTERQQDLVRICAWSRRLEFEGRWLTTEEYLRRRFGLEVTHGMSQEALNGLVNSAEAAASVATGH
jgi:GAF domain-containing protein